MKKIFFTALFLTFALFAVSAEKGTCPLTGNGKILCKISFSEKPDAVEKHAAEELLTFLAKISGTEKKFSEEKNASVIRFVSDEKAPGLEKEGYALSVNEKGITVTARRSVGFLYAVYGILRDYGKIRFLFPGEDGEYFTKKESIAVPFQNTVKNPSFPFRTIHPSCAAVNSSFTGWPVL